MKQYSTYVGMDCGDRFHHVCVLNFEGEVVTRKVVRNRREDVQEALAAFPESLVALEVGTHSRWLQRTLEEAGHAVLVANPRKMPAISRSDHKTDREDAELLARFARFDPKMLHPIVHRGRRAQLDLAVLKARDALVRARTSLINCVRGLMKSEGYRAPSSSAEAFAKKTMEAIPEELTAALRPLVEEIAQLTERIRAYDQNVLDLADGYPEVELLRQVPGVGPITALAYVLTLEDPHRFAKSRSVGPFLGLTPKKRQSGEVDKELRITKHGDAFVRRLLVSAAQYILGPLNKQDSVLKQHGLELAQGGTRAKKRAVVAVARKLAVLLHRLWVTGGVYEAFPEKRGERAA